MVLPPLSRTPLIGASNFGKNCGVNYIIDDPFAVMGLIVRENLVSNLPMLNDAILLKKIKPYRTIKKET